MVVNFRWRSALKEDGSEGIVGLTVAAPWDTRVADCDIHEVERGELGQREKSCVETC